MAPTPPTPPVTAVWIRCIKAGCDTKRPQLLQDAFELSVERFFKRRPFPALHMEMRAIRGGREAIENMVAKEMGDDWKGFNDMMVSFLWLLEAADQNIMTHERPGFEDESKKYFERMKLFMISLNSAFNHPNGAVLSYTAMNSVKWCILVAFSVDKIFGDISNTCAKSLLAVLLRTFNASLSERNPYTAPGQVLKKTVAVDLGNHLFRLYDKLNQNRLTPTVLGNLNSIGLPLEHPYFRRPTLCTFFYYQGIEYMRDHAFLKAHYSLQDAYDICHPQFLKQRRKILIPLLASSLLIGRFPSNEILSRPEAEGLYDLFFPVCMAIRKGDFRAFRVAMGTEGPDTWKAEWWEQQRLKHMLEDRTNILLWRSLVRKIWLLTCGPHQKQHIIRIKQIWVCAVALHRRAAHDIDMGALKRLAQNPKSDPFNVADPTTWWYNGSGLKLGEDQVENIVLSLLDQKLVRGYLVRQPREESSWLVLSKSDPFPNLFQLFQNRMPRGGARQPAPQRGGVVRMNGVKEIGG